MPQLNFDGAEVAIPCAQCGHKTKRGLGRLKREDGFICAGCGVRVVPDVKQLEKDVTGAVDRAAKDFAKRLKALNRG